MDIYKTQESVLTHATRRSGSKMCSPVFLPKVTLVLNWIFERRNLRVYERGKNSCGSLNRVNDSQVEATEVSANFPLDVI